MLTPSARRLCSEPFSIFKLPVLARSLIASACTDYLLLAYRWAYLQPISASGLALLPVSSASLDAAVPSAALRAMPWRIAAILNKL